MAEWVGLLPAFAFVLTVGISVPVALASHLLYRAESESFARVLQVTLLEAGLFYLLGVFVLQAVGAGPSRVAMLVFVGAVAAFALVFLPLFVGRWTVRRVAGIDSGTALRRTTYCWPIAMLVVFAVFVVPGGLGRVALFHLGGPETCLLGFCGVSLPSVAAILFQAVVALFGPGVLGVASVRLQ